MKAYMIADLLASLEKEYQTQGKKEHADAIHQALALIRRVGSEDDDPISEPARGQLFPLLKRAGLSLDDLKVYLQVTYGITSTKAIPWGLYEVICAWLLEQGDRYEHTHRRRPSAISASSASAPSSSRHRQIRPRVHLSDAQPS